MPVSANFRRWAVVGLLCFGMVVSYVDRGNISHVEFYMRGITESWLRRPDGGERSFRGLGCGSRRLPSAFPVCSEVIEKKAPGEQGQKEQCTYWNVLIVLAE